MRCFSFIFNKNNVISNATNGSRCTSFHQQMILPIQMINYWNLICSRKKQLTDKNIIHQSQCRFSHDYKIDEEVLLIQDPTKLSELAPHSFGPFCLTCVHTNGTITICHDIRLERINIPNVKPYY